MLNNILLVALGGAGGSVLRYLVQYYLNDQRFPYGTLIVNLLGCFIIGILWSVLANNNSLRTEQARLLFVSGFCGGFTTFSAFTSEGNRLLLDGKAFIFILYISISVAGGLLATYSGYKLFAK
jgi:fluoride exporter